MAMESRFSCRAFTPQVPSRADLEMLIQAALRAPSGSNTQPWKIYVLQGDKRDALVEKVCSAHNAIAQNPQLLAQYPEPYDYYPEKWVSPYIDRRRENGWSLYGLLGITKGDKDRMQAQHQRNFRLFDAPVGLMFTLDREQGSWVMTDSDVKIPEDTKEFAINMSNMRHWDAPVKRYIDECLQGKDGARGKDFNMRWIASMVADVHRILTRGGIFMYPWDKREPTKPGKLRLMYEANPMSFLVEQAGGMSTNGTQRIMELQPGGLHERVSVVLGSKNEVERVTAYHREAP